MASVLPVSGTPLSLRDRLDKRWSAMKGERETWIPHWRDLSDYILPRRGRFLTTGNNKGDRRNNSIIDTTGTIAARTLSAGMMSGMSSPARPWFKLASKDYDLNEYGPVKEWLGAAERRIRQIFHSSNVYNALPTVYAELGVFGTGCAIVCDDFEDVLRMDTLTVGEYCAALNHRRVVDTVYREMRMTVIQVCQAFCQDGNLSRLSHTVRAMYDRSEYDQWVTVMHAIEPNHERDSRKIDNQNMPFRSVYWEADSNEKEKFLRKSGFEENPIICPRWDVSSGSDVYGRSPGMDALGDVRQLQLQTKRKGQGIDRVVNPPLIASPGMRDRNIDLLPGKITIADDFNTGGVRSVYEGFRPDIGALREDIEATQERVRQAFFADLFLAITEMEGVQPRNQFELSERKEEKLIMLGPVVERLQNEMHDPLVERAMNRIVRLSKEYWARGEAGILPPPPEELSGEALEVNYISMLAQAQKGIATGSVERLFAFGGNLAGAKPEVLDKLDFDQAIDEMSDMLGVPARVVRSDEKVEELRKERAAREQAMQLAAAAKPLADAAGAARSLSETEVGPGRNALQAMLNLP